MRKNGINKRKVKAPFFIPISFQKENKMLANVQSICEGVVFENMQLQFCFVVELFIAAQISAATTILQT
jgi:hypothetical protein